MAEYWIRQHASGNVRGPVTAAQLKLLANQGELKPSDEVGKSREGPWNRADRLQGLQFAGSPPIQFDESDENKSEETADGLPDFAAMLQEASPAQDSAPAEVPIPSDDVVHIDAGLEKDAEPGKDGGATAEAPSTPLKELIRLKTDSSDDRYPALRMIAKAHQTMGVACLFLAAVSLIAFLYFVISYAISGGSAAAAPDLGQQPVDLDDFAEQLQNQLLQASSHIESARTISKIWGSFFLTIGLGWGAMLCFAFAQVMMLFMDLERNTRRE